MIRLISDSIRKLITSSMNFIFPSQVDEQPNVIISVLDNYFPLVSIAFIFLSLLCYAGWVNVRFRPRWLKGHSILVNDFVKLINVIVFFSSFLHLIRYRLPINFVLFAWTFARTAILYRGHTFLYLLLDMASLMFSARQLCFYSVGKSPDVIADTCSSHGYFSGIINSISYGSLGLESDVKPFVLFVVMLLHFIHLHYESGAPLLPVGTHEHLVFNQTQLDVTWKFLVSLTIVFGLTFYLSRLNRKLLKNFRVVFSRYVSTPVAEELLSNPNENLEIGGEKRHVAILMSDLRGFSSLLATLEPEQAIELMNAYLEDMMEVIAEHGGTVDEIIGDALLVIFGLQDRRLVVRGGGGGGGTAAVVDEEAAADAAVAAVRCAAAMQRAMSRHPRLSMGIGVHSGQCVVGNIGSKRRCKFGIIGSAINMAARIESFSLARQIVVSDDLIVELMTAAAADADQDPFSVSFSDRRLVHPKGAPSTGLGIALIKSVDDVPTAAAAASSTAAADLHPVAQPVSVNIELLGGPAKQTVDQVRGATITHIDKALQFVLVSVPLPSDLSKCTMDTDIRFRIGVGAATEVLGKIVAVKKDSVVHVAVTFVSAAAAEALSKLNSKK